MRKSAFLKLLVPVLVFIIGCGVTLLVLKRWDKSTATKANNPNIVENRADIPGLNVGEVVELPELTDLNGRSVELKNVQGEYLLCAIFSTECPGCANDAEMWKDLSAESTKRNVPFYLISTDDNQGRVKKFAMAYSFDDLPVLFSQQNTVLRTFKIQFVPQYLLLTKEGKVVQRWNGVTNYDPKKWGNAQIVKFFKSIPAR